MPILFSCSSNNSTIGTFPKVSVQLHSVRDDVSNNFENTLKTLASMGFEGVEFAGRYGPYTDDAKGLKSFLNTIGLEVSGAHLSMRQLKGTESKKHLTFLKELGAKLIIIPFDKRANNPSEIDELIADFIQLNTKVNEMGMLLGYHNHSQEFDTYLNSTFWDYIAENTPQNFVLQLDAGWVNFANKDPITYVKRYSNRTLSTHIKVRTYKGKPGSVANNAKVIIGQDDYAWDELIQANIQYGGTQWLVVEQEEYPKPLTPIEAVDASLNGLNNILTNVQKSKK